jgi:hypothetical protein
MSMTMKTPMPMAAAAAPLLPLLATTLLTCHKLVYVVSTLGICEAYRSNTLTDSFGYTLIFLCRNEDCHKQQVNQNEDEYMTAH